jgi:cytochrome c oxidase assembly protein subunit 15
MIMKIQKLSKLYLGLTFYTTVVILWGAWVRISHSGDGCGASWPLCHDGVIPSFKDSKTWVEYTHRMMSGIFGIMVIWLALLTRKMRHEVPRAYTWAKVTFFFTITEALLGAKLVLFGLVGSNDSLWRSFSMALHFLNSLMLVFSTVQTFSFLRWGEDKRISPPQTNKISLRWWKKLPLITLLVLLGVGVTGTIAALSNTLFPVNSLSLALAQDLDANSHILIRLRGLHPILGLTSGLGLTILFYLLSEALNLEEMRLRRLTFQVASLCGLVTLSGTVTILLHAPIWMKLGHLGLIYTFWVWLGITFYHTQYRAQH